MTSLCVMQAIIKENDLDSNGCLSNDLDLLQSDLIGVATPSMQLSEFRRVSVFDGCQAAGATGRRTQVCHHDVTMSPCNNNNNNKGLWGCLVVKLLPSCAVNRMLLLNVDTVL